MAIASDTGQSASARNFWLGVVAYIPPHISDSVYMAPCSVRTELPDPSDLPRRSDRSLLLLLDDYPSPYFFMDVSASVCRQQSFDHKGRVALRARRRSFILVVHNAGCRSQVSNGFNLGLRAP